MRSLWRMIASRWLGGQGSDALTGDSALLDLLTITEHQHAPPAFRVSRQSEVSHHAIMSRQDQDKSRLDPAVDEKFRGDNSD
jgi:hypothetical protein